MSSGSVRTAGINLSTRPEIVWRRGEANINPLLHNALPETRTAHEPAYCLPYEIVEMIIAPIARDLGTLKAFSLTCRSWYIAVVPHLHHTLTLKDNIRSTTHDKLRPLSELHQLDLIPFVKAIQVDQWCTQWFAPRELSRHDLRYFSAFTNVQTLRLGDLDISRFIPGIEHYFGHFSPILRSIEFTGPRCTPRQLSHFLSLFSNLDDISICGPTRSPNTTVPDTELVSFSTPRLRGQLVLRDSYLVETWTDLIAAGGGPRFYYMMLYKVGGCASILFDACAETLETLRFCAMGDYSFSPLEFNLSPLKVLRALEIEAQTTNFEPPRRAIVMEVFSTIASPAFSELAIVVRPSEVAYALSNPIFETLHMMSEIRPFKVVFLLTALDCFEGQPRRKLEVALDLATERGLFDFLDSPPTIRRG